MVGIQPIQPIGLGREKRVWKCVQIFRFVDFKKKKPINLKKIKKKNRPELCFRPNEFS